MNSYYCFIHACGQPTWTYNILVKHLSDRNITSYRHYLQITLPSALRPTRENCSKIKPITKKHSLKSHRLMSNKTMKVAASWISTGSHKLFLSCETIWLMVMCLNRTRSTQKSSSNQKEGRFLMILVTSKPFVWHKHQVQISSRTGPGNCKPVVPKRFYTKDFETDTN